MASTQARRGASVLIAIPDNRARRRWRQGLGPRFRVQEVASRSALEHDVSRSRPARVNGRRTNQSVGFDVTTCDFNPTIVVGF